MEIIALSGATVAKLHDDEIGSMAERGSSVRDLKLLLANRIGFSRFQQGLLSEEIGELQDDMDLRPLPTTTGNPALCAPDETAKKELHRANNMMKPMMWLKWNVCFKNHRIQIGETFVGTFHHFM